MLDTDSKKNMIIANRIITYFQTETEKFPLT